MVPKETSWFGYYPDGSFDTVLPAQEVMIYKHTLIQVRHLQLSGFLCDNLRSSFHVIQLWSFLAFKFLNLVYALQTLLYTEDWIGLKTLDEAGKVKFINVSGGHLDISQTDMKKYILPYLEEQAPSPGLQIVKGSSSDRWFSTIKNNFMELVGRTDDQHLLDIRQ